ncbi:putative CDP-alcohol phosphatidyltransferase [Yersinia frederiksenii]|uniref:Inner membrane protein ynbA n=2 Tax=Yersinia frederiksenii TaxID=29484 RepID=A0ABR4W757_YERFR|nr:CDP-alcohol phosphatidyltransferase family protein [Yersinia frederiksenii]ATM96377.1 CDP-alcohol phosphatidyltransferase family protein [Yersinia frederiksenii]EEQ15153.1 CDP-alcohol phosphatidyltransferase [Yersinia frederiksenii ATCC 33641]KGA48276.1 inner membrane protein ynbA [Yersinia frederiksenii ATCC 33641]MDN0120335.1 CDP-alcohol phosphatidyltransferase family protein [Yersinia frederiksenii]CFQ87521.1 putative CDP-alcohol phosphatidyltransferase [Yersinia frederiksenii]
MTLYDIKPRFQALLRPCLVWLHLRGVTANQVTLFALIASLVVGSLFILFPSRMMFVLLPVFLFFRMALNAIDGMLAREFNQQSQLGALLNEIGDIISDAALYLPFALLPYARPELVILAVFLALLSEFCGVMAQTLGRPRGYQGPMGKSDRALLFGTYGLAIALWPEALVYSGGMFAVVSALLLWTCINRCRAALKPEA